jgi:hypothetical protein
MCFNKSHFTFLKKTSVAGILPITVFGFAKFGIGERDVLSSANVAMVDYLSNLTKYPKFC